MGTVERRNETSRLQRRAATIAICVALLGLAACSGSNGSSASSTTAPAVTTTRPRPSGPVADLSTRLTGGNGVYMGEATKVDLPRVGYVEHEYAAAGTAGVVQGGRLADA